MHSVASNKEIIQKINEGLLAGTMSPLRDHLADDARWFVIGPATAVYRKQDLLGMERPGVVWASDITVSQVIEDDEAVVVEGTLWAVKSSGDPYFARYCDIYHMKNGRIQELTRFVVEADALEPATPALNL